MKTLNLNSTASAVRRAILSLGFAVISFPFLTDRAAAQTPDAIVDVASGRSGVVFTRANSYDYVPSIMKQDKFRMWWCGGFGGDSIFYAESDTSIAGPWHNRISSTAHTWVRVFWGTKDGNAFDSQHTCDPSVILHQGEYYMYYGGLPQDNDVSFSSITRIGVVKAADGGLVHGNPGAWQRFHSGPIVSPSGAPASAAWIYGNTYIWGDKVIYSGKEYVCIKASTSSTTNPAANTADWRKEYGVGQPSVVAPGDGWIYMFFTDTTAAASGVGDGAGIYVIRSSDPTFQTNTEELQSTGWTYIGDADSRAGIYKVLNTKSVDVVYSDVLENFIIVNHQQQEAARLHFFSVDDPTTLTYQGMLLLDYPTEWRDGPGIVRGPEGRALPGDSNDLDLIPIDIIYGYQTTTGAKDPSKYDLRHAGYDLVTTLNSTTVDARVKNLFRGWKLKSTSTPALPLVYVTSEATRLQCESSAVPSLLTGNLYDISSYYFYTIPFGSVLRTAGLGGLEAWTATGRTPAFLMPHDTNRLWRVSDSSLITANGTTLTTKTTVDYDTKTLGPYLYKTVW